MHVPALTLNNTRNYTLSVFDYIYCYKTFLLRVNNHENERFFSDDHQIHRFQLIKITNSAMTNLQNLDTSENTDERPLKKEKLLKYKNNFIEYSFTY